MQTIKRYFELIEKILLYFSQFSLIIMMLLTSVDALFRYFLNHSITGAYEVTEYYLMIMLVFLSLSYVQKQNGHIRLDILFSKLPNKVQNYLNSLFYLLAAWYMFFIGYQGFLMTKNALLNNLVMSGLINFPLWLSYTWVPIGAFLIFIRLLFTALRLLFIKTYNSYDEVSES